MTSECAAESIPAGYKQTEVGVIPEDWKTQPLGELVTFLDGKRKPVKFGRSRRLGLLRSRFNPCYNRC